MKQIWLFLLSMSAVFSITLHVNAQETLEQTVINIQQLTNNEWVYAGIDMAYSDGKPRFIFNAKVFDIDPTTSKEIKDKYYEVPVAIQDPAKFLQQIRTYGRPSPINTGSASARQSRLWLKNPIIPLPFSFEHPEHAQYFFHDEELKRVELLEQQLRTESYYVRRSGERTLFRFYFSETQANGQISNYSFTTQHPAIMTAMIRKMGKPLVPHHQNNDMSDEISLFPDFEVGLAKKFAKSLSLDLTVQRNGYDNQIEYFLFKDPKSEFSFKLPAVSRAYGFYPAIYLANLHLEKLGSKNFRAKFIRPDLFAAAKKIRDAVSNNPKWQNTSQEVDYNPSLEMRISNNNVIQAEIVYDVFNLRDSNGVYQKTVQVTNPLETIRDYKLPVAGLGIRCEGLF